MSTKIKICGLTRSEDVQLAAGSGADLLGFVFARSPRRVTPEKVVQICQDLPEQVLKVGVFVDAPLAEIKEIAVFCHLDLLQLHGSEDDVYCRALSEFSLIRVLRLGGKLQFVVKPANENLWATLLDTWLPDQAGGGGRVFDWQLAEPFAGSRFLLAGGLTPDNVKTAIAQTRPFGVDVSSGVEAAPGIKDREKIARFINAVKEADKLNISITEQVK